MLKYVLYRVLWQAAIDLNKTINTPRDPAITRNRPTPTYRPLKRLRYMDAWSTMRVHRGRPPALWRSTFLSKDVLVTQEEIVSWVLGKIGLEKTLQNLVMIVSELNWQSYGVVSIEKNGEVETRRVAGLGTDGRRDFVRLKGFCRDTGAALSVQVNMSACFHYKSTNNYVKFADLFNLQVYKPCFPTGSNVPQNFLFRTRNRYFLTP